MGLGIDSLPTPKLNTNQTHQYVRLATFDPSSEAGNTHQGNKYCFMRLTRFRLITLLVIFILTVVMVLYTGILPSTTHAQVGSGATYFPSTLPTLRGTLLHSVNTGRIRYKHTNRRLPQCLIIGARKAGTRALLTFLDLHPQIRTAKNEVHFFDDDENFALGLEWYRKKMPYSFPGQVTLEKTPAYFTHNYVPERVRQMNSTIKLLLILRDPVDRAISDYLQIHSNKVTKNKQDLPFEQHALDEYGNVVKTYNPIERSLYFRYMSFWLRYFSLEQFLIISGENLVKDPIKEIRRVEQFLGLEHRITEDNFVFNDTRGFYCIRNETYEKCLAESKGRRHPDVNPLVLQKLRDFFRPYNLKFYQQTGIDFGWS